MQHQKRNTCLFVAFFLLAGIANMLTFTGVSSLDVLMTECNYLIYVGLLLFWIQSVRGRLLPSRARAWMIGAGLMMLFFLLLRNMDASGCQNDDDPEWFTSSAI